MSFQSVYIVGAGYAGLMTAIRLAGKTRRHKLKITIINPSMYFFERIRLQDIAVTGAIAQTPICKLLNGTKVDFIEGSVMAIDRHQCSIKITTHNETIVRHYDKLILAMGSRVDLDVVPGVAEYCFYPDIHGRRNVLALHEQLETYRDTTARVVVIGGGASGVEVAAMVKSTYPTLQVELFSRSKCGNFKGEKIQAIIRQELLSAGVCLHEGIEITSVQQNTVTAADGSQSSFDIAIWCGGLTGSELLKASGFDINQREQVLVDGYLRTTVDDNIYAVGDVAWPQDDVGAPMRISVFTALVMGAHCADILSNEIKGRVPKPLAFSYFGQGIALGENNAVGFMTFPNDNPVGPIYRKRIACTIRNFFVWFVFVSLKIEKRMPGFFFWLGKKRVKVIN